MNRRKFLKISTAALATNFTVINRLFSEHSKPVVWEVEGISMDSVDALFSSFGGLEKLISTELSQATVLIKPNLCLPHASELGTTTSPSVMDAICDYLIRQGIQRIIITDHTLKQTGDFQNIALSEVVKKYAAAKLIFANEQRLFQPTPVQCKVLRSTEILKMLSRADLLINVATAKHHSATHVSLAIKNLMGLIWSRTEFHTQLDLSQAIGDLALAIRPGLNIIDASRVLLNGGPTGPGPVITENRLFASFDILALDSLVLSRYNFGGKNLAATEVPHLWAAYHNGVGEIDLHKIRLEYIK